MDQPLEANFFPGILEGLAGRLGLTPPGELIHPPCLEQACPDDGQQPLGRLSELRKEEISTSSKSCVPWSLQGSIWTMAWISEPGGLMT